MRDDIRKKTVIIDRRNNEYLVGKVMISCELRWSIYPYDAWRTRDREKAERIARAVGGITMLFNPVVRQIRVL